VGWGVERLKSRGFEKDNLKWRSRAEVLAKWMRFEKLKVRFTDDGVAVAHSDQYAEFIELDSENEFGSKKADGFLREFKSP
jgi:hypothetical protein